MNFLLQDQFNTSICSNVSFTEENKTLDEYRSQRSNSVRFKESEHERSDSKIKPVWRPAYESDTDTPQAPQYKSIKPILTPTTGRSSSVFSVGASPIPPTEFEKPQKFTSTNEQFNTITRDFQVLKPKPVSAQSFGHLKPSSHLSQSTRYYTATTGPPYHNQNDISCESSSHMEIREATESSQRVVNVSSTRKVVTYDQQQHQRQSSFEKSMEPFPFTVSPTSCISRQKLRPPPTPTKFIPGEFRESDYDSEIESMRIRPIWTPNPIEADRHYRHVSPPTPSRCASVPRHHFERIVTPMEFDRSNVEMPSQIKCLPSSPTYSSQQNHFKTQTLDRFRTKKKTSTHFGSSSQDDINVMHSTPKYSRRQSPAYQDQTYHEENRSSQYGKSTFIHLINTIFQRKLKKLQRNNCMENKQLIESLTYTHKSSNFPYFISSIDELLTQQHCHDRRFKC